MKLRCYKTLWGFDGLAVDAVNVAVAKKFDGIEGPLPADEAISKQFVQALQHNGLYFIAEIATTGIYVPNRQLSLEDHLSSLQYQLNRLAGLPVEFVTCLGGCDAWPLAQSVEFFQRAMALADESGIDISFETHRGRSLFNPWVTRDIVAQLPNIKLTFDISHWSVVCEGLQETEALLIELLAAQAHHIHARVGYDQGPQVPDPRCGVYRQALQQHLQIWSTIWQCQQARNKTVVTVTPEFGPDGYEYRDILGTKALVDIEDINCFMAATVREHFVQAFSGAQRRA